MLLPVMADLPLVDTECEALSTLLCRKMKT